MTEKYHKLYIQARNMTKEIWLGDDEGNFVAKGVGVLDEGLLPDDYVVSFSLKGKKHTIHLDRDLIILEEDFTE